jgi:hypothetical protein
MVILTPKANQPHWGSESGLALRNYVGWEAAIASKLAPTGPCRSPIL